MTFTGVHSTDNRGSFAKPFHAATPLGEHFRVKEIFWTVSARGTVRGMHFQLPPHSIGKLVWVSSGEIIDVVVDLRHDGSFGSVESFALNADGGEALWVPPGFAHGFQALTDHAIVNYAVNGDFHLQADAGIRWDSINFPWPLEATEISERDQNLPALHDFPSRL